MSVVVSDSVVSKKIESARKANTPIPRLTEVLAETTKRLEKELRAYVGTVAEAMIMEVDTRRFSDILDGISMPAMIGVVEVDGVDRAALVNMDLDLVYHIVDLRLGGLPTELPEFVARRPTAVDSAMCDPVVGFILDGLSAGLSVAAGAADQVDMRCSNFENLPMLANIVPDRSDALYVQVSVDIGEAARSGNFELVLPFITLDFIKARLQKSASATAAGAGDAWAAHMLDSVLETGLDLTPIVHSSTVTVADMSRLEVGQVIPLELGAEKRIKLMLDAPGERISIAEARLGAVQDAKALKLTTDPDHTFFAPLREKVAVVHGA